MPQTETLADDDAGIARAAHLLREGGLVAFPTETVYGLGADARNDHAVARIFAAKDRPRFNPLIVHLPDAALVPRYADMPPLAERLASAFWPGPLTLVLPLRAESGLSPLITAGHDAVALRVPAHSLAARLLAKADVPVAAPSANPSGRISPTSAAHVLEWMYGRIDAVLDGEPCEVGLESTILSLIDDTPTLLRPGGLPAEALEDCLGHHLARPDDAARPVAPGQLASHYAPRAKVRLDAETAQSDEIWLGFGHAANAAALNLSPTGDLVEAAANLFRMLRDADAAAGENGHIAVSPVPDHGLGRAINDRLRRAAAPR